MNKTINKVISSALALIFFFTILVSCANSGNNEKDTADTKKEASPYVQDDGLPEKDYDGETVIYLSSTDITGGELAIIDTEDSDNALIASIFRRTKHVESRYNVDVQDYFRSYQETYSVIYDSVSAQDGAFDACYGFLAYLFPLAIEGFFSDFDSVPYINLEHEWWDQNARKAFTVANRLFYMTGDANMFYNDYTWALFFNKQILADTNGDVNLYDLVRNKEWTVDKMLSIGLKAKKDVNGDGKYKATDDIFGMVTHQYTANALLYGCNELFFAKDKDDMPYITFDNERIVNVCEKVSKLYKENGFMLDVTGGNTGTDIQTKFSNDEALFAGEVLQCSRRYRGMNTDFGVLPYPLYDDSQKNYVSYSLEMVYPVAVPNYFSGDEFEKIGIVTEALQSASHNSLYKAYFDAALTSARYLRDDESEEMIKIIFDTRCFPLATMKDFGGVVGKFAYSVRTGYGSYGSLVTKFKDQCKAEIEETVDKIEKLVK